MKNLCEFNTFLMPIVRQLYSPIIILQCIPQGLILIMVNVNLIDLRFSKRNALGIPASNTVPVLICQWIALIIAVATQSDILTVLSYLHHGYVKANMLKAFPNCTRLKWAMSLTLQFLIGSLGLFTTFLLIVSSSDVVDLLLNFTAGTCLHNKEYKRSFAF